MCLSPHSSYEHLDVWVLEKNRKRCTQWEKKHLKLYLKIYYFHRSWSHGYKDVFQGFITATKSSHWCY